ncbi:MAG: NAD(P)-dependent oxidoreductase [Boseongicola sp.]|nr:NAD(P)-dependent oxidoreductase [Boseongicola sp.]
MKIGFIGLGAMGMPMTARLSEAFPGDVLAFDPSGVGGRTRGSCISSDGALLGDRRRC